MILIPLLIPMLNLDTRITLGTTLKILHQYIYVIKIWKRKKDAYDYHGPLFTSLMTSIVATILMYFLSHDPFDFPDFGIHFDFICNPFYVSPFIMYYHKCARDLLKRWCTTLHAFVDSDMIRYNPIKQPMKCYWLTWSHGIVASNESEFIKVKSKIVQSRW